MQQKRIAEFSWSKPMTHMFWSYQSTFCHPYRRLACSICELSLVKGTNSGRFLCMHGINPLVGPEKTKRILFFTGCDGVSAFSGKGKKYAWQMRTVCPQVIDSFAQLNIYTMTVKDHDLKILEKFVATMYEKSSTTVGVDDTWLHNYVCLKTEALWSHSPNSPSACQVASLSGRLHLKSVDSDPARISESADWGWTKEGDLWQKFWTILLYIAQSCQQLTDCGCKTECPSATSLAYSTQHCVAADANIGVHRWTFLILWDSKPAGKCCLMPVMDKMIMVNWIFLHFTNSQCYSSCKKISDNKNVIEKWRSLIFP